MTGTFTHTFDTPVFKGTSSFNTGLFIGGKWIEPVQNGTCEVINPTNGKSITSVSVGTKEDVDVAVRTAQEAYDSSWGLKVPGAQRGKLLGKLADLVDAHREELAALEALNNGKAYVWALNVDVAGTSTCLRYYAGWADKNSGQVIETNENKLAYTRHEPIGVVGQIIPWNFPLGMLAWKIGPALATGNTIVLKPSELTPLSALRLTHLINEAGFPPGVVNIVNGYGATVGQAIAEHMDIAKVAFTGSTAVGRKILESAAKSNLKKVTLELGGKSPNIIFEDADLEQAVKWSINGIFFNAGQACTATSRIYVHEKIYDQFLDAFTQGAKSLKLGDPFAADTFQGPQVSIGQFNRVMGYISSGREEGATVHVGGEQHGKEGYYIHPTIFTNAKPHMKIVQEEIFGPVAVVVKFSDEEAIIKEANDTQYGLAAAVFTKDIDRAFRVVHRFQAGTCWINCSNVLEMSVPFGGYKQSGLGRELGEHALQNYTNVKAVHVNLGMKI